MAAGQPSCFSRTRQGRRADAPEEDVANDPDWTSRRRDIQRCKRTHACALSLEDVVLALEDEVLPTEGERDGGERRDGRALDGVCGEPRRVSRR